MPHRKAGRAKAQRWPVLISHQLSKNHICFCERPSLAAHLCAAHERALFCSSGVGAQIKRAADGTLCEHHTIKPPPGNSPCGQRQTRQLVQHLQTPQVITCHEQKMRRKSQLSYHNCSALPLSYYKPRDDSAGDTSFLLRISVLD